MAVKRPPPDLRLVGVALLLAVALALTVGVRVGEQALWATQYASGWLLLAVTVFLASFNLRKRAAGVPLGPASRWLEWHVYAGMLSLVLFGLHMGARVPRGGVDVWLAVLFVAASASGIAGLVLSRTIPARVLARANPVLFERIPGVLHRLRGEVAGLVARSVRDAESTLIPEFYRARLAPYLAQPQLVNLGRATDRARPDRLCAELAAMQETATPEERDILRDMGALVSMKGDIDRQYTADTLLKGWLFLHVPLAYGTLLLASVHALLAYAFSATVS